MELTRFHFPYIYMSCASGYFFVRIGTDAYIIISTYNIILCRLLPCDGSNNMSTHI